MSRVFRPGRFVRILCYGHGEPIWGLMDEYEHAILPLWCADRDLLVHEFGELIESNGIVPDERATMRDGDDVHAKTPAEAWAALAYYKLTGQRIICERN